MMKGSLDLLGLEKLGGLRKKGDAPTPTAKQNLPPVRQCDSKALGKEVPNMQWPGTFLKHPAGERVSISDDAASVTRQNGVGRAASFVGPLTIERDCTYFEVEIMELESGRSQTMALGLCSTLPSSTVSFERASDLGRGSYMLGYDLPKFYANGMEVEKIPTKQWRPLKELAVGDRVGLLAKRSSRELSIIVNGEKKVSVIAPGEGKQTWPAETWGVVDVCGSVKTVKLCKRGETRTETVVAEPVSQAEASQETQEVDPPPCRTPTDGRVAGTPKTFQTPGTEAFGLLSSEPKPPVPHSGRDGDTGLKAVKTESGGIRRGLEAALDEVARPAKRLKLPTFQCGCTIHLICHSGNVVHVPRTDFLIGRSSKVANLMLDNKKVPNMVSRRHARIVSTDDGVELVDCESVNGTWLNGERAYRKALCQGDVVVVGDLKQSTAEFRFTVSMPLA